MPPRNPPHAPSFARRLLGLKRRYSCEQIAESVGGKRVGAMAATELKRFKVEARNVAGAETHAMLVWINKRYRVLDVTISVACDVVSVNNLLRNAGCGPAEE